MAHTPSFRDLIALTKVAFALFGDPAALAEAHTIERRQARAIGVCLGLLEALARALLVMLALALPRPKPRDGRAARPPRRCGEGAERGAAAADASPTDDPAPGCRAGDAEAWRAALDASAGAGSAADAASTPLADLGRCPARDGRPGPACHPSADDTLSPASERWPGVVFHIIPQERRAGARAAGEGGGRATPSRFVSTRSLALRFEALCRVAERPERYAFRLARRIWSGALDARSDLAARLLRPPVPGEDALGSRETLAVSREAAWLALERVHFGADDGPEEEARRPAHGASGAPDPHRCAALP